ALAPLIRKGRTPLPADNPFVAQEQAAIAQVSQAIEDGRKHRDEAMEWWFALVFGSMPGRIGAA
ncbi:MAG: poly(3-hydroxyalkanoate) synthetase, partial [Pseudomonadota bacterium]